MRFLVRPTPKSGILCVAMYPLPTPIYPNIYKSQPAYYYGGFSCGKFGKFIIEHAFCMTPHSQNVAASRILPPIIRSCGYSAFFIAHLPEIVIMHFEAVYEALV